MATMHESSEYDLDVRLAGPRSNAPVQDAVAQPMTQQASASTAGLSAATTAETTVADVSASVDAHHAHDSVTSAHSEADHGSTHHEDTTTSDDGSATDDHVTTDEPAADTTTVDAAPHADETHDATADGGTEQQS
jgi:hypothetical protein